MKIWGVGSWTCDMVSIFYFKKLNIWPVSDLSATKKFRTYIDDQYIISEDKALSLFSPYRSLLAMYMWKILDT